MVVHMPAGWLRRMQEIQTPSAAFSRSHTDSEIDLSQCGAVASLCASRPEGQLFITKSFTAQSDVVMRDGRHYATFVFQPPGNIGWSYEHPEMLFGLKRSCQHCDWSHPSEWVHCPSGACFCMYCPDNGLRYPEFYGQVQPWWPSRDPVNPRLRKIDGANDCGQWQGSQDADEHDTIGLLLDFDTGTLTVFKNGERLGVMATNLEGEYRWAVVMKEMPGWGTPHNLPRVCIESAVAPTAPTAVEVAVAAAFEAKAKLRRWKDLDFLQDMTEMYADFDEDQELSEERESAAYENAALRQARRGGRRMSRKTGNYR